MKRGEENKMVQEIEMDVPTSAVSKLLFCRKKCFKTDRFWIIFWRHQDDTFGITNGETRIYEKKISVAERRELVGNVSASLLTDKWRKIFEDHAFTLVFKEDELEDDEVEVEMAHGSVTLERIKEPWHIADLVCDMVDDYMTKSKKDNEAKNKENAEKIREIGQKRRILYPKYQLIGVYQIQYQLIKNAINC
uniref:Uncharacterized protein n=1 Tax=Panagrolaimus sp. ES5 TaxID=591445 RepID=A0AC34FHJ3_9BILA